MELKGIEMPNVKVTNAAADAVLSAARAAEKFENVNKALEYSGGAVEVMKKAGSISLDKGSFVLASTMLAFGGAFGALGMNSYHVKKASKLKNVNDLLLTGLKYIGVLKGIGIIKTPQVPRPKQKAGSPATNERASSESAATTPGGGKVVNG